MKLFLFLSFLTLKVMAAPWNPEVCFKACALNDMRCHKIGDDRVVTSPFLSLFDQKADGICDRKTIYGSDSFESAGDVCLLKNSLIKIEFPKMLLGIFTQNGHHISFQEKSRPIWRSKAGGDNELKGEITEAKIVQSTIIFLSNNLYISCIQGSL